MFKKAQLKLFAIITCILLAIFIAVLGSVNIIMQAVMQRQSKDVLKKIAAGVEYDEKTSRFNITRPENFGQKPMDEPPFKPDDAPEPPASTEEQSSTEETDTTAASITTTVLSTTSATASTSVTAQTTQIKPPRTTSAVSTAVTTAERSRTVTKTVTTHRHTEPTTEDDKDKDDDKKEDNTLPPWMRGGDDQPFGPPKWGGEDQQPYTFPQWGGGEGQQPFTFPQWGGGEDQQPYTFPQWGGGDNQFVYPFWNFGQNDNKDNSETPTAGENKALSADGEDYTQYLALLGQASETADDFKISDFEDRNTPPGEKPDMEGEIPRSLGTIDFFIVMADKDGNFMAQLNNEDLDKETAQKYISAILKESSSSGMIDNCYQFYQMEKSNGTIMVFTDKSAEIDMLRKLNRTTIIIGTVSLLFLTAAAFFLSRQVMKPLRSAFEKQKQFISDASHELKTPLTVISANADVLSGEIGENRWLTYIKSQTDRMNVLVNDLLNLTRLENNTSDFIRTDFDLSKAVVNTALPFECQAFESDKQFDVDVEKGLTVNGSERHIKQMIAIFIDNALKYSGEGGKVKVTLRKQGDKKVLTVFNTGTGIKSGEEDKIFERFYRSDESRNRSTGGYGLGLAIAKSIIDKHKFKVHVDNDEGNSIAFVVTM